MSLLWGRRPLSRLRCSIGLTCLLARWRLCFLSSVLIAGGWLDKRRLGFGGHPIMLWLGATADVSWKVILGSPNVKLTKVLRVVASFPRSSILTPIIFVT